MDSLTQRLWEMLQSLRVCDLLCVGSHLSSFCSSRCCGRLWPGQSLRSSWCCSPWPGRSWLLGPCVCTGTEIHNSGDGENHNSERALPRMISKHGCLLLKLHVCADAANANMSNWVKIPHMPYHVCVWAVSVHWHACAVMCMGLCTCETVGSVTFQQWEQAWGWFGQTWLYPHCENFTVLQYREAFVMRKGWDNPGIGRGWGGQGSVFRRQRSHSQDSSV